MQKRFSTLSERPGTGSIISAVIYSVLAFFTLPFILLLFLQGSENDTATISIIELFFHIVNFILAVFIFREYLTDTFDDLRYEWKRLLKTASVCSALILLLALVLFLLFAFSRSTLWLTAHGTLPLTEVELFLLPGKLIKIRPIIGTVCLVFLAPLTIGCLYYAAIFAPVCYRHPVLAYFVMAAFLAFPRLCNAATYWDPAEQWTLYFTQLPGHMLACRAYQKTDSIWASVLPLSIVNLISGCLILFT